MAALECDRGNDANEREGRCTTDLGESTYWRTTPDELELMTPGGRVLRFSAIPSGA